MKYLLTFLLCYIASTNLCAQEIIYNNEGIEPPTYTISYKGNPVYKGQIYSSYWNDDFSITYITGFGKSITFTQSQSNNIKILVNNISEVEKLKNRIKELEKEKSTTTNNGNGNNKKQ